MSLTLLQNDRAESDKTDRTYIDSNLDFLNAIFGNELKDEMPVIVSFPENPRSVSAGKWKGKPWNPSAPDLPHGNNNYFSLAVFKPDENGRINRKKDQFSDLYAVMLDDLGTKIPMERLTLPSSWLIETSEGNHQAGYILTTPINDGKLADRLMNAIIDAGLCDEGAGGVRARLARLPFAVNGKIDPALQCRLKEWNPDLRYSADDLVHKLELDMSEKKKKKANGSSQRPDGHDEIFRDCPSENPVITALNAKGLYKTPLGNGKHDITCPWVCEHTEQADGGTAYFEPDDTHPIGGFKCLHGHCANRHVRELLAFLSIEPSAARMKPTIRCIGGEIHRIAYRAEETLAKMGRYYQRGGLIVTVTTDPGTKDTFVKDVSQAALVKALSSAALWERFDGRVEDWVRIDPPARYVNVLYDATDYSELSSLNGLTHQPFLRPEGTLATMPGYDPLTGMFGIFETNKFYIPDKPTRQDAENALGLISGLLGEFSFAQDTDHAAALCAILTASIRPSLPLAPMFHVRAPQISSGKSFLCQVITAFAAPRRSAAGSFPNDDDECRKLLLAELLRAPAVIEFDNMTTDIYPHKSLCSALTTEWLTGRILGVSKTATVSTRTLFLSSGNNVGPVQDMARRCLTINLDPQLETPAERTFKNPHLLSDLQREREKYVSAALTIIRAWIVAERPMSECRTLASYGEWSDLCRQPLLWLGIPDAAASVFVSMNDDPDRELLGRLLHSWKEVFGSTPKMIREAISMAGYNNEELKEALHDIAGERDNINRRLLGHWIKRHANRIVDGLRFVPAGGTRSAAVWRVESVA